LLADLGEEVRVSAWVLNVVSILLSMLQKLSFGPGRFKDDNPWSI